MRRMVGATRRKALTVPKFDLETDGVQLVEALDHAVSAGRIISEINRRNEDKKNVTPLQEGLDLFLCTLTPLLAYQQTYSAILDPYIKLIESGDYLKSLKKMRDHLAGFMAESPVPSTKAKQVAETYRMRKLGGMN